MVSLCGEEGEVRPKGMDGSNTDKTTDKVRGGGYGNGYGTGKGGRSGDHPDRAAVRERGDHAAGRRRGDLRYPGEGLEAKVDDAHNVVVRKPASRGQGRLAGPHTAGPYRHGEPEGERLEPRLRDRPDRAPPRPQGSRLARRHGHDARRRRRRRRRHGPRPARGRRSSSTAPSSASSRRTRRMA